MEVEQMRTTIKGMIYELSEVFARLGDQVTEKDEDRMIELIHLISTLDFIYVEYVEEEAQLITNDIMTQVFGPRT